MSPDENITLVSGWIVRADAKPNCRGKRPSASGQLQTFGRRREVVRFVPRADITSHGRGRPEPQRREVAGNRLASVAGKNERGGDPTLRYGFVAGAQNPLPVSTTCAFAKPAAMSVSDNPLFGCCDHRVP
jgi:hypothetical protein